VLFGCNFGKAQDRNLSVHLERFGSLQITSPI
jgi:hypothetical protein